MSRNRFLHALFQPTLLRSPLFHLAKLIHDKYLVQLMCCDKSLYYKEYPLLTDSFVGFYDCKIFAQIPQPVITPSCVRLNKKSDFPMMLRELSRCRVLSIPHLINLGDIGLIMLADALKSNR